MTKNFLEVREVSKVFGTYKALNSISMNVPEGSIFGLLGPNGAGKTTLIRIINQITFPDSGQVFFNGNSLALHHTSEIGYLPEERGLYKSMKVGEQALYLAQLKGLSKSEAKARLNYWFEKFEIGSWWNKKVQDLSKGMAQKIQFIVTVLHRPKLLIFDEPFSGFDPVNANLIKDEILQLRDEGATILFSTHRMESVEELCDHIALIHKSNKLLEGKINEVKTEYKTNTFQVGLTPFNQNELLSALSSKFEIQPAEFKTIDPYLKLHITLPIAETSNALLQLLISKAKVHHFSEVIPTVNEIFIKNITAHG